MIDNIYKILLIVYPLIAIWVPEEYQIINKVIGISFIILFLIKVAFILEYKRNVYFIYGLLFGILITVSIIINNTSSINNWGVAAKYIAPLMVGAYSYQFIGNKFLKKLFTFYFYIFFLIWLFRFIQLDFHLPE